VTRPWIIENGRSDDLTDLRPLLASAGLPVEALEDALPDGLLVARSGGSLIGAVALQPAGVDALLRSLVVHPDWRGRGLGEALVTTVEALARARGVGRLYLLTETAAGFFPRHGYEPAARGAVPDGVAATAEFRSVCPETAVCLGKILDAGG
jgi:amino-acid N-acetyltransferase